MKLIDATLREGCQAPGVSFTVGQSVRIARELCRAGVDTVECGHPLVSDAEAERVKAVVAECSGVPVLAHARTRREDIDAVAASGAAWVGIFLGINGTTLKCRVACDSRREILDMIGDAVGHAHGAGLKVRYTLEDSSRTKDKSMLEAFRCALAAGADRICFSDTVGVLEPEETRWKVEVIRNEFPDATLELHLHDDRGLALANALAGIDAGADWISTSVNGLGERAGIVDLCALMANLHYRGSRPLPDGVNLRELSETVATLSGRRVDAYQPVVGKDVFTHTAALHVAATARDEGAYSWIKPELVGGETKIAEHIASARTEDQPDSSSASDRVKPDASGGAGETRQMRGKV